MKTFTLSLLAVIASVTGRGQQLINQKDAFSGKQIKMGTVLLGGTFKNIGQILSLAETDGKKYISFVWMPGLSGANVGNLNFNEVDIKKCSLLLKMDNDSIFRFKADTAISKRGASGQAAGLSITAPITDDQLKFMMSHTISIIRLGLTQDNLGVDAPFLTDKLRKQVQNAAAYILDTQAK